MYLRFALVFVSLSLFFAAEAQGQLFGRFSNRFSQRPAQQYQPYGNGQQYGYNQTYGYQGQLTAKPRYRSNVNYFSYDANGRLVRVTNQPYANGQTRPSCSCQKPGQQLSQQTGQRAKQTQQTDLAGQFRATAPAKSAKPGTASQSTEGLVLKKPNSQRVAASPALNEPATQIRIDQASNIPVSDKITNPVPSGLSLSTETAPGQIMPATAIVPAQSTPITEPQESFSVLQKID